MKFLPVPFVLVAYFTLRGFQFVFSTLPPRITTEEVLLVGSLPWSCLAIAAWIGGVRAGRRQREVIYQPVIQTAQNYPERVSEAVTPEGEEVMYVIDDETKTYGWKDAASLDEGDLARIESELTTFEREMVTRNVDWMVNRFEELRDLSKSPSGAYLSNNISREIDRLRKKVERRKKNYSPTPEKIVSH